MTAAKKPIARGRPPAVAVDGPEVRETTAELRAPSPAEVTAITEAKARQAQRPARPAVALMPADGKTAKIEVSNPHSEAKGWTAHVTDAFGTTSHAFADLAFGRVLAVARERGAAAPTQTEANAALALMGAIAPADEFEAAIGEQIIGLHTLTMDLLSKARHADLMDKLNIYTNLATKTARTTAVLVESLAKHRSGGKQTHEVRYVYVNGSAIFGDGGQQYVAGGGGGGLPHLRGQSLAPAHFPGLEIAPGLPMRGEDAARDALPVPSGERPQALQDARRDEPRSPEGEGERGLPDRRSHAGGSGAAPPGPPAREGES